MILAQFLNLILILHHKYVNNVNIQLQFGIIIQITLANLAPKIYLFGIMLLKNANNVYSRIQYLIIQLINVNLVPQ